MPVEIKVPSAGESITEVEIGEWLKQEGASVKKDENVVVLESEKASMELPSPVAGVLTKVLKRKGEKAEIDEVIALVEPEPERKVETRESDKGPMPEINREALQKALETKTGVLAAKPPEPAIPSEPKQPVSERGVGEREEEVVPMSLIRRTIADRLVEAQQSMAILTTFNEIDMAAVMGLRKQFQESFTTKYNVKLGFMSFFVKATVEALKAIPQVNASIRDNDIIYHNYYDIGIAIGSGRGLVVPVLRNAERMSFADVEKKIMDYGDRAQKNALKPDELQGGTFTITNGGIYGSLLSTPIINPPQSAVLGMHAIQERPVVVAGQVVIRPMMYVALSYDHRLIDGREAVTFLRRIKELIENPARMLLEV